MSKIIFILLFCFLLLIASETWLRSNLFDHVSFSNSESIDTQLRDRNKSSDWNILFVGDSETRWGIDPREIDRVFRSQGIEAQSFNHAFDGFGVSWWSRLLPSLLEQPTMENIEVVVLGANMIEAHRTIEVPGDCGPLQIPVLTSPFAMHLGINSLCQSESSWDEKLTKKIFNKLWLVKYSSAVRTFLLPSFMSQRNGQWLGFNSRKSGKPVNGFIPHKSIAEDREIFDQEFARWKAQYVSELDFVPMIPDIWDEIVSQGGFFDQLHETIRKSGRKLVLFALPTNPLLIDTFKRREDYLRNSRLLQTWAKDRDVVFVDMGIQDVANNDVYFSDMRHLSEVGAKEYSEKLGKLLVEASVLNSK